MSDLVDLVKLLEIRVVLGKKLALPMRMDSKCTSELA